MKPDSVADARTHDDCQCPQCKKRSDDKKKRNRRVRARVRDWMLRKLRGPEEL